MLFSSLYYPYTTIDTNELAGERLLKRALLLWDELHFIVPDDTLLFYYPEKEAEAIEIIGHKHVPSDDEKQEAHTRIEELLTRPGELPEAFLYQGSDPYEVYSQKFMEDTWKLLKASRFAGELLPNGEYPVTSQVGLTIMAILADCCAGSTLGRVTDRAQAYAGLTSVLGDDERKSSLWQRTVDATLSLLRPAEGLISLRLSMLDIDLVSLDKLVDYRKREWGESGHTLRDLRHRYAERIENQVLQLSGEDGKKKRTQSDITELERTFAQQNEDDLRYLQEELRTERKQGLISRDVIVTCLGIAGRVASVVYPPAAALSGVLTPTGLPVTVGGLIGTRSKYLKARADILRKHPMSFLYELGAS